jgi:hypothetical protein
MRLVGMLDSPYVRRVAIFLRFMGTYRLTPGRAPDR